MAHRVHPLARPAKTAPPVEVELVAGWGAVRACWRQERLLAEASVARMEEIGARFVHRLQAAGLSDWRQVDETACRGFITARTRSGTDPRPGTQHLRRSTVRAVFRSLRQLRLVVGDPTLDLRLPARSALTFRPLTDDEVVLCRASSRLGVSGGRSLLRATAWALGEATATSSEIGAVRLGDLDDPYAPRRVWFPGSRRRNPREGRLSEWGRLVLARHASALTAAGAGPDQLLAYTGAGPAGAYLAQASVCTGLTRVMALAGLREDPGVRPGSLRGWAGRRLYEDGLGLEEVTRRLGATSLDAAATEIGLSWKHRNAR